VTLGLSQARGVFLAFLLCFTCITPLASQRSSVTPEVPDKFKLDFETAARLRPQLRAQSTSVSGRYVVGRLVLQRLVDQVRTQSDGKFSWELRVVNDGQLNAYSAPDGTIYLESGLAELAGPSAGLWAAIVSHEMAHVIHRDWARRYLYERSLQGEGGATLTMENLDGAAGTWMDSRKASEELARFCRQVELEADTEGLMIMARAGYHPDFVPALHHLLQAHTNGSTASIYSMHPAWDARDRQAQRFYVSASIDFDHRWPDRYASPGGNPPTLVFADEPTVKRNGGNDWEVQVPMRCQNLVGAVEVVVLSRTKNSTSSGRAEQLPIAEQELRQLSGCTSPKTTVSFTLPGGSGSRNSTALWSDVYVLDGRGAILSRTELPRLQH
jgi:Zn-dependent protease with chaperone function